MSAVLKNIITDIRSKQNSLYLEWLDNYFKERNYTPEETQNALKNRYQEILDFFREKLQSENKADKV